MRCHETGLDLLIQKIIEWALGQDGKLTRNDVMFELRENADLIEAGHYDYAVEPQARLNRDVEA
jgi:hypothetical protein